MSKTRSLILGSPATMHGFVDIMFSRISLIAGQMDLGAADNDMTTIGAGDNPGI